MATRIYTNGISTSVPGVYSSVDASGLQQTSLSATGIVALLGTATGGVPFTAAGTDPANLPRLTSAQAVKRTFASGDLLEAGLMLLDSSSDPNVVGGAQVVVGVQVNPEEAAKAEMSNGSDALVEVSSIRYGTAGNTISAVVAAGTASGTKKLTLSDSASGLSETKDNLANAAALVAWVNSASQLASAKLVGDGTALPDDGTETLAGGSSTDAQASDWQDALDLLKGLRVNSIVCLTGDQGIAAALEAHCAFMCGAGKSERNGFVGLDGADADTPPALSAIKQAGMDLNSRHVQLTVQQVTRFDSTGTSRTFPPYFLAALAAGMQAAAGLGEPLTFKYIKAIGIAQDRSWSPVDNADDLIEAGALIAQRVDGRGIRWVRNVTTYQADDNLAFIEASTNACVNFLAFTVRAALEFAVGRPGFAGTQNAVKTTAIGSLGQLVQAGIIAAYSGLTVTPNNDTFEVAFNVAPALPVNFVPITLYLQSSQTIAKAAA